MVRPGDAASITSRPCTAWWSSRQLARRTGWPCASADEVVTYGELNARANQLAHHLMGLGVARGDVVGVHLDRSVDMVVSVLAVLKTGAAYVPLDPSYPEQRLGYMLSDTGAQVVISRSDVVQLEGVSAAAPARSTSAGTMIAEASGGGPWWCG